MRFILQKSETPNHWVCTDMDNNIVCFFEQGKFNDSQKFTLLEDFDKVNVLDLARYAREMADYLRENHYEKIF